MALDHPTPDPQTAAALALHRFGLGPRADTIGKIAADPRGALLADLDRAGAGALVDPDLLTSAEAAQAGRDFRQVRKAARLADAVVRDANQQAAQAAQRAAQQAARAGKIVPGTSAAPDMSSGPDMSSAPDMQAGADMKSGADPKPAAPAAARDPGPGIPQQIFLEEAKARLAAAASAEIGFAERLVWFWSNHFCISAAKGGGVAQIAGA